MTNALTGVVLLSVVLGTAPAVVQPEGDPIVKPALVGWEAARLAARNGGSPEALAPAAKALAELDAAIEISRWRLQGSYARALVAAAMAAAQDERAELEVHLTHARDLSDRLDTSAYPAELPKRFDEAAGELWYEVEEYAEAVKAFELVVARRPTRAAWLGLARSAARLDDAVRACAGYRQVAQIAESDAERDEARAYLTRCP